MPSLGYSLECPRVGTIKCEENDMDHREIENIKDQITFVQRRIGVYGIGEATNWFCKAMTQASRDLFDRYLVHTNHPLSFEAGSQEARFLAYFTR